MRRGRASRGWAGGRRCLDSTEVGQCHAQLDGTGSARVCRERPHRRKDPRLFRSETLRIDAENQRTARPTGASYAGSWGLTLGKANIMTGERIVLRFGSQRIVNGEVWIEAFNLDRQQTCQLVIELCGGTELSTPEANPEKITTRLQENEAAILRHAHAAFGSRQKNARLSLPNLGPSLSSHVKLTSRS